MSRELFDYTLVMRVQADADGVDFLFMRFSDMLSIGMPIDVMERVGRKFEILSQIMLRDAPTLFPKIFGERWNASGLLAPTPDDVRGLEMIPDTWHPRHFEKWRGVIGSPAYGVYNRLAHDDVIVIHPDHTEWIPGTSGWSSFLEIVKDPEAQGLELVGSGSEGKVYKLSWEGRVAALKVYDPIAQARMVELAKIWRVVHPRPNFLTKVGYSGVAQHVFESLVDMACDARFTKDYAYGRDFHLTEFIDSRCSVEDLLPRRQNEGPSDAGAAFIASAGVTVEDLERLKESLDAYNRAMNFARFTPPFAPFEVRHDSYPTNVLVEGFDQATRRFRLAFIDQSVMPSHENDPIHQDSEQRDDYAATRERFAVAVPNDKPLARFFATYFPNGFPNLPTRSN